MEYRNAKDLLDGALLRQLQEKAGGQLLYVPIGMEKRPWGTTSGEREKLRQRNRVICREHAAGRRIQDLAQEWFLSVASIRKILAKGVREQEVHFLGIHLGPQTIHYGITDAVGTMLSFMQAQAPQDTEGYMDALYRIIDEVRGSDVQVAGVGVSFPGRVEGGNMVYSTAVPLDGLPLRDRLSLHACLPVRVDTAANCGALGATRAYTGEEANVLYLTISEVVDAGVITNSHLRHMSQLALGAGHILLEFDGKPCSCGKRGCLERYVAMPELLRQIKQATTQFPDTRLAILSRIRPMGVSLLFQALSEGCEVAAGVLTSYCRRLGAGLDSLCSLFRPQRIIVAGEMTRYGDTFLRPLRSALHTQVPLLASENEYTDAVNGSARLFEPEDI